MGEANPHPLSGCQETAGIGGSHLQGWGSRLQKKRRINGPPLHLPIILSRHVPLVKTVCERWKVCEGTSCLLVTRLSLIPKVSLDFDMLHNVSREEKVIFTIAGMRILLREEAAL